MRVIDIYEANQFRMKRSQCESSLFTRPNQFRMKRSQCESSIFTRPNQFRMKRSQCESSLGGVVAQWLRAPDCCPKVPGSIVVSSQSAAGYRFQAGSQLGWYLAIRCPMGGEGLENIKRTEES